MSETPCEVCNGTGWYTKTVDQFERDNRVPTHLDGAYLMQFPCLICDIVELTQVSLGERLSNDQD